MKIKSVKVWVWAALGCLLLAGGCFGGRSPGEADYFDLYSAPGASNSDGAIALSVGRVGNLSAARNQFQYLQAGGMVTYDTARYWVQTPEQMLRRVLFERFAAGDDARSSANSCEVNLSIYNFSINLQAGVVKLGVGCEFQFYGAAGRLFSVDKSANFTARCTSPEAAPAAFSLCVQELAGMLRATADQAWEAHKAGEKK